MKQVIAFGISGAMGRMGRTIARLSTYDETLHFAAALEKPSHEEAGSLYEKATGIKTGDTLIGSLANLGMKLNGIIDFSSPESSIALSEFCAKSKIPLVVGTTGFSPEQRASLEKASASIPMVVASNMSVGVNVLFAITKMAAQALKDRGYDPEIMEIHHKLKKDAPSGTAKTLEEIISNVMGWTPDKMVYGRSGITGERKQDEMGVMALRGGDVVGDHTVYFLGEGERIEIKHQAVSRDTFAMGALAALRFLQKADPGLYSMGDVLGIG